MQLAEELRDCVAHIVVDASHHNGLVYGDPIGTAFCVGFTIAGAGLVYYLVTARHVLEPYRGQGAAARLSVRVNKWDGGCEDVPTNPDTDWTYTPDNDIALARFHRKQSHFFDGLSSDHLHDGISSVLDVHVGDHVLCIGLLLNSPGKQRNEPIVRFGRVSRTPMPGETVDIVIDEQKRLLLPVEPYLVEMLSWGGHSGSPVFAYLPEGYAPSAKRWEPNRPYLIGLMHGHFEVPHRVRGMANPHSEVDLNSGIAVVIPTEKILDALEQPHLEAERDEIAAEVRGRP